MSLISFNHLCKLMASDEVFSSWSVGSELEAQRSECETVTCGTLKKNRTDLLDTITLTI